MKKLTQTDEKKRAELVEKIGLARQELLDSFDDFNAEKTRLFDDVKTAVKAFNDAMDGKPAPIHAALAAYNATLAEAKSLAEEVIGKIDDYVSGKSEKWSDSDKGQGYMGWREEWDTFASSICDDIEFDQGVEALSVDEPDDLEADDLGDLTHSEDLDTLPTSPEEA